MKISVVVPRLLGHVHAQALDDIAEPLCEGLKANGLDARIVSKPIPDVRSIIVGPHMLEAFPPADSIFYNTEQVFPDSPWFQGTLLDAYRKHKVWDYNPTNVETLRNLGVDVTFVPIGYAPSMTRVKPSTRKPLDVLFLGSVNERRKKILVELGDRGVKVMSVYGLYGADRDDVVSRAKIVLNVHFYEVKIFEAARISYLLANRAFVVTEESAYMPWQGGYIAAPYDKLVETCMEWLSSDLREHVACKGFEAFSRCAAADMVRPVAAELSLV
jgi:hypothetical protein